MKHFKGKAILLGMRDRGISSYQLAPATDKSTLIVLCGTFTADELRAVAHAASHNDKSFEFPDTVKPIIAEL